jgi:hypothetical protein
VSTSAHDECSDELSCVEVFLWPSRHEECLGMVLIVVDGSQSDDMYEDNVTLRQVGNRTHDECGYSQHMQFVFEVNQNRTINP